MKTMVGIGLLPISLAMMVTLGRSLGRWDFFEPHQFLTAAGFVTYGVLHVVWYRPLFAYVVAHEFTHALWAWLLGREVGEVNIKGDGGHVTVGGPNAFITLVPYFFPLYTVLTVGILQIAKPAAVPYLMFFLGMTLAFHVMLTVTMLLKPQSDLRSVGYVFGLSVILFMNLLVFAGLAMWLFPNLVQPTAFVADVGSVLQQWLTGLRRSFEHQVADHSS